MAGGLGTMVGPRRRSRLVLVCVALAALFGSGVWRMTGGAADHGPERQGGRVEEAMLRAAGVPDLGSQPAAQPSGQAGARTGYGGLAAVDWSRVRYPLHCRQGAARVQTAKFADVNSDGAPDATVLVRCAGGTEQQQPTGLYVYTGAGGTRPRLLATLLKPSDGVAAIHVTIVRNEIKATGFGYSSPSVPRCCPDETIEACWEWDGTRFTRVG